MKSYTNSNHPIEFVVVLLLTTITFHSIHVVYAFRFVSNRIPTRIPIRMLSETDINTLKQSVSLSSIIKTYIDVRETNTNTYQCLCPFHDDKNPSMGISDAKGFYNCFRYYHLIIYTILGF
jgi:hypothetical protein